MAVMAALGCTGLNMAVVGSNWAMRVTTIMMMMMMMMAMMMMMTMMTSYMKSAGPAGKLGQGKQKDSLSSAASCPNYKLQRIHKQLNTTI